MALYDIYTTKHKWWYLVFIDSLSDSHKLVMPDYNVVAEAGLNQTQYPCRTFQKQNRLEVDSVYKRQACMGWPIILPDPLLSHAIQYNLLQVFMSILNCSQHYDFSMTCWQWKPPTKIMLGLAERHVLILHTATLDSTLFCHWKYSICSNAFTL